MSVLRRLDADYWQMVRRANGNMAWAVLSLVIVVAGVIPAYELSLTFGRFYQGVWLTVLGLALARAIVAHIRKERHDDVAA